MNKKQSTVLIVAGGTGGHIMPALSIAESIKKQNPALQVEFLHGPSLLEKDIYAQTPFRSHVLCVGRLRKNVSKKERIKTIIFGPWTLLKALIFIIKIKPVLLLGTGGAISGLVLLAGALLRKKTVLFEPNALPGLSNRWVFPFVDKALLVFESAQKHLGKNLFLKSMRIKNKIKIVSFPVRSSILQVPIKEKPSQPLRVLILGGSQGAGVINKEVGEMVCSLFNKGPGGGTLFSFVHQTGQKEFAIYKKKYANLNQKERAFKVFPFLHEIHKFYAWADIVVGRAGAGFLAEVSLASKACILIPLKNAADQHQLKNALVLKNQSSAMVIEEKDFNKESLHKALQSFVEKPEKIKQMSSRLHQLKLGGSAEKIASYLQSLL